MRNAQGARPASIRNPLGGETAPPVRLTPTLPAMAPGHARQPSLSWQGNAFSLRKYSIGGIPYKTHKPQVTIAGHALGGALLDRARKVQHRRLQSRRWRKPRNLEDLLLVKRLPRQQGFGERIELLTVCAQESLGLIVALADDLEHLGVDGFAVSSLNGFSPAKTVRAAR